MKLTRSDALLKGAIYYYGKPCRKCGGDTRYTSNGACWNCHNHNDTVEGASIVKKVEATANRDEAGRIGNATYTGLACRKCGESERYTANGSCTRCNREAKRAPLSNERQVAAEALKDAIVLGAKHYTGTPCKKCGNTERFTSNSGCVACIKGKAINYKRAVRMKYHSTDALVIWVNEPPAESVAHLYKLIPALAANPDAANWSLRYTDAHHLASEGMRLFTGRDVFERPQVMQHIRAEYTLKNMRGGHYDIAPHISAAMTEAIRKVNTK